MSTGLIIGKFMPFHMGHKFLIDFALAYQGITKLYVGCYTMPKEPIPGINRAQAIQNTYGQLVKVIHHDIVMPQEPADDPDFWNKWVNLIRQDVKETDLVIFASENYGQPLAEALGGRFVPVSVPRNVVGTSGTALRIQLDIMDRYVTNRDSAWQLIAPEMRKYLTNTVTIFGSESTGKTTMTKILAQQTGGQFVPEYARSYLETVGTELTDQKLIDIANGQEAQDCAVLCHPNHKWIFRDTDLLTTVGYTKMYGKSFDPIDIEDLFLRAAELTSDLYVVLDTDIPFEADPLRYGGDHRDSDTQYWIDLLEQFGAPYVVVSGKGGISETYIRVIRALREHFSAD